MLECLLKAKAAGFPHLVLSLSSHLSLLIIDLSLWLQEKLEVRESTCLYIKRSDSLSKNEDRYFSSKLSVPLNLHSLLVLKKHTN
jgi:hypothetical protein